MTVIRLIADDLTGALDSAAQFAGLSPLPVWLRSPPANCEGSFALDLSCRDGPEAEAVARTRDTLARFQGADIAFKKIDSLLRGHWAAEIAVIAAAGAFRRIVLAPAFPAQGRITSGGIQRTTRPDGGMHAVPIEPIKALARLGVEAHLGRSEDGVSICDASSQDDLAAIVASARSLPGPTLWCGSAGLAQALAGRAVPTVVKASLPHLVVVGTNHPVAAMQVAAVRAASPAWLAQFNADGSNIADVLAENGRCVAVPDLEHGTPPDIAAARIREALAALSRTVGPPATLTVVGGETFAALCASLGADRLIVAGERLPGVPASIMTNGAWAGTRCFSKSGAFGAADWLTHHLQP